MDLELNGKLALVSGSTAGIGLAIAAALAREGARVVVNGRAQSSVDEAAARLRTVTGGDVQGFAGDLSSAAVAEAVARQFPDVEILVNNLGIFEPKPFEEIPDADWVTVLRGQCAERRSPRPALSAGDETRQLGADHLYFERKRSADPGRDDPLRDDQDGADRGRARPGGSGRGHRHHRQQRAARPDEIARRRRFRRSAGEGQRTSRSSEFEKEFFEKVRPTSLIKRFASPRRSPRWSAYVASPLASATTGAALRVDGGVIKSAF